MSMNARGRYWFEDGSVVLSLEDSHYKVHQSLLARLSPDFFNERVGLPTTTGEAEKGTQYEIKKDLSVAGKDFEVLLAHLYHDVPLDEDTQFEHVLRLYITTAPSKLDFKSIHRSASRVLQRLLREPMDIDFDDFRLLQEGLGSTDTEVVEVRTVLKRALIYAYTVHPTVSFGDDPSAATDAPDNPACASHTNSDATSSSDAYHVSGTDALLCERLMTAVADRFSPTLFQPPAARHMECTDVYAALWMERAVQLTFDPMGGEGTANPFKTLKRLRGMDWKIDGRGGGVGDGNGNGARTQPCEECLQALRDEWAEEALSIWNMMGELINV